MRTVQATEITDVSWIFDMRVIEITLDAFPSTWGNWTMYVDGEEMPVEGGVGKPVVRPNAALDKPPTGLLIGTEPWVISLDEVDFPCCGTIQFDIPGEGFTNKYEFNLVDLGCETASQKECPSEWIKHYEDMVIEGMETKIIENAKYFQQGNIYVNDEARLVIKNSQLMMGRGKVPTVHCYIFVDSRASLEIENSTIFPEPTGLTLVVAHVEGKVDIKDSPTEIHLLSISEGAQVTITDSEVVGPIGGLIQVEGGDTRVINSTIGAVLIGIPGNSRGEISGLRSGVYLESWDIHRDLAISNIPYDLTLEKVHILKDTLPPGPYERGWIFYINPEAKVRISNSELRKVLIPFKDKTINLENLKIGIPSNLKYKEIELSNVTVKGQWGIDLLNPNIRDVTIKNSNFLFIQIRGQSNLNLIDSDMVEFIPRDFFGTINFKNCTWHNAGEIIGGTPYHSMENNFTIRGSLKIRPELKEHLQWHNALVRRVYDVSVLDRNRQPIKGISISIDGKTFLTDDSGKSQFTLIFNDGTYLRPRELKVIERNKITVRREIDFFTETPIIIIKD